MLIKNNIRVYSYTSEYVDKKYTQLKKYKRNNGLRIRLRITLVYDNIG